MNQSISHINNITPRCFRMLVTEFFCQKVCCFTNNHDVIDNSMKAHHIGFHVIE